MTFFTNWRLELISNLSLYDIRNINRNITFRHSELAAKQGENESRSFMPLPSGSGSEIPKQVRNNVDFKSVLEYVSRIKLTQ